MKYLSKYKESIIYDADLKKFAPSKLSIIQNGNYNCTIGNIMKNSDMLQITYVSKSEFGEPDTLEIDLYFLKVLNKIKIDVDITWGDKMVAEFSITPPNNVSLIEDTTYRSKFDKSPEDIFAFHNESLKKLVEFFNMLDKDINLTVDDFKFLDKYDDYFS